ncbi:MAG: Mur ligase family protein [Patescibacteria group bacterium]
MARRAHLIGIAGAGMSALAILLREAGWKISGSDDNFYDPIYSYLKKNKVLFFKSYRASNIPRYADLIVIGKHVRLTPENPEVKRALSSGKTIKSLPETLAMLAEGKEQIVVAGSFGKSTGAALIAWCLVRTKKSPSYFIGAIPEGFNSSHLGRGKYFVLEGDEYPSAYWDKTSKFLHFDPTSVLLISGEHDHVNVFPTEKSYKEPYKKLVAKISKYGLLVYSFEGKNLREISKYAKSRKVSYALKNKNADWYTQNIKYGAQTSFDLIRRGKKVARLRTPLLGNHNIENVVGAGALLLEQKMIGARDFARGIGSFKGLARRLDLKTKRSSVPVYKGLGSSYTKAKSIFDALKLHFSEKRIIAVFEPKTFSWRNRFALKWYKSIFDDVSEVIMLPPPAEGKRTHDQLTHQEIFQAIKGRTNSHKARTEKETLAILKKITKKDSIIALVSSGSLLGLSKSVPKLMEKLFPQ